MVLEKINKSFSPYYTIGDGDIAWDSVLENEYQVRFHKNSLYLTFFASLLLTRPFL
jgi:hypothetical protein